MLQQCKKCFDLATFNELQLNNGCCHKCARQPLSFNPKKNMPDSDVVRKEKTLIIALAMGFRLVECTHQCFEPEKKFHHQCLKPVEEIKKEKKKAYMTPNPELPLELCDVPRFFVSEWARRQCLEFVAKHSAGFISTFMKHLRDTTGISAGEVKKPPKEIKDAIYFKLTATTAEEVAEALYRTLEGSRRIPKEKPKNE